MSAVLPQPGARAAAAMVVAVVVAGTVLPIVLLRGALATASALTWMDGTSTFVAVRPAAPWVPLPK